MKIRTVKYLAGEGAINIWVNRLMSIASIGVLVACMVVIGLALLIAENVDVALGNLQKQNVVMVYMKDYSWALYGDELDKAKDAITEADYTIHNADEAKALCAEISKLDNIDSVVYVSADEGLASIKEDMIDGNEEYFNFLDEEHGNPLSDAAKVTMKDTDIDKFKATLVEIEKMDGVSAIQSQTDLADKITAVKRGIQVAGFWIIAILMVISLVIVANTIRVTMYNRKLEISIMKAVGATDAFVRIPFIVEGMIIGIISALVSEGLLYFCYRVATERIATTLGTSELVGYSDMALWLLLIFLGIGVFAGALGSVIMISKYLRKEGSEFAAI